MKRTFMTIAIAVSTIVMASCGNKKAESPATESAQNTEATEQVAEQSDKAESQPTAKSGVDLLAEDKTIDMEAFSVTIPKGWKQPTEGNNRVSAILPAENYADTYKYLKSFTITALKTTVEKKMEQDKKTLGSSTPVTQGADVSANGITWKVLKKEQAVGKPAYLYAPAGDGKCVYISLEEVGADDEEIKTILESVTIK